MIVAENADLMVVGHAKPSAAAVETFGALATLSRTSQYA